MPRFDVYTSPTGPGFLLDCQADLLSHLNTRFVVPLIPAPLAPKPAGRLNPVFAVNGEDCVMVTQFAAAVELRELGARVASLAAEHHVVVGALDVLLSGV